MDARQFDPTIARWTAIDPITHHHQSTYSGFDNNPIYWADPSGASTEADQLPDALSSIDPPDENIDGGNLETVFINVSRSDPKPSQSSNYVSNDYSYYGSNTSYESDYPEFSGMDFEEKSALWSEKYSDKFDAHTAKLEAQLQGVEKQRRGAHLLHFGKFMAMMWGMGGNYGLGAKPLPTKSFNFKGILSVRQKIFYDLNFNTNRGSSYFTQDAVHNIFPKTAYRQTIFQGTMTTRNNGTYGFEYKGSFKRYELGIKPNGTVIHNNSFKLQKWDSNLTNWWK